MASPSFEADDQTDEDFFDKLVDDDDDDHVPTVSLTTHVGGDGAGGIIDDCDADDEAKLFSNLNITEGVSAREADSAGDNAGLRVEGEKDRLDDDGDATIFESLGSHEDAVVDKETAKMLVRGNVNDSSEAGAGDEGGLASRSSLGSGKGVKVVQWSSFNSDLNSRGDTGLGSDFFDEWRHNSEDPFANVGNVENAGINLGAVPALPRNTDANLGFTSFPQSQHSQRYGSEAKENVVEQHDLSGSKYVENQYPGWRYDLKTGQWYQVEEYDANALVVGNASVTEQRSEVSHSQLASQPAAEIVDRGFATNSVEYPAHMVFDPNYPGWYYDTIAQEWKSLDTHTPSLNQSASADYDQHYQYSNIENFASEGIVSQDQVTSWTDFAGNYNQQTANAWETQPAVETESTVLSKTKQTGNQYSSASYANITAGKQAGFKSPGMPVSYMVNGGFDGKHDASRFQSFSSADQVFQHHNQTILEPARQINLSPSYPSHISPSYLPGESGNQFSRATGGRSFVGRPPHALVTFGFGGKLLVMKNESSYQTRSAGGIVSVLNLMEVVMEKTDASSFRFGGFDYFQTLGQQSFPGPLVGRNVGTKEVNKWIDESLANSELPFSNARSGEVVRLLFSLLKIACQYYGKLRSPFVGEQGLNESDCPESAVAKLFASPKSNGIYPSQYGAVTHCLQNFPSEAQIQATAIQVQNLLVSGRKKEALQCAQEGQLWGPALVVASQLGEQFYGDTVKQMALKQLVPGSPLQTLCLLIAGNPADLFSRVAVNVSNPPGSLNTHRQLAQMGDNGMLDKWGENLAVITSNRTKGDELVIIHLGDCLWKDRGEVTSAHICYLVAEANFEPYSEMARLCLIGADHLRYPRTYASPEAIQRTELYEYSKVLGNSQFLLLPFQPYKLVYAHMLAEVGKVADSLKYCQAILKSLKAGRALEVDTLRQLVLSLEERLKIHQKGGYGNNLASTKLASTLINYTARVVGNLPPPMPLPSNSNSQHNEYTYQSGEAKVSSNPSATTIPLSASMGPISEWGGETNRSTVPNRSVSEPDIGRSPNKVDSSKEPTSSNSHEKQSVPGGPSRIGRFGSQLFQKTVGLVLRSRPSRQAKLGDSNKFYYDEKLKRWVEEGAEPPAEEAALPPPPTTGAFLNSMLDHNTKDVSETGIFQINSGPEDKSPISSDRATGIPPMPPSSNQFSARGRMGVRSRYVDTFNKGGASPASIFQSPAPAAKTGAAATPKFFIPPAVASVHETSQERGENTEEPVATNEKLSESSVSSATSLTSKPAPAPSTPMYIQRFPSVDNIISKKGATAGEGSSSLAPDSRRVASWSGSTIDSFHSSSKNDVKPLGEELGTSPSAFASNAGGDPHEVQL